MEKYELENTREFKAAMELENALNDFGWKGDRFAKSVRYYHRTLQQELFRTILKVIKMMGSDDYGYDLRNEAAHRVAKKILESGILNDEVIPFI